MKKLMIAAAAAAMLGGAYASDECVACGYEAGVTGVNPAFYDVAFKLKTLAPKVVKCGGCEGVAMEQATRTLNGLYWTCDNCVLPYQFALWEKSSQTLFTSPISYLHDTAAKQEWTFEGSYLVTGTYTSNYEFASKELANQACLVKFGAGSIDSDYATEYNGLKYRFVKLLTNATMKFADGKKYDSEAKAIDGAKAYVAELTKPTGMYDAVTYVSATTKLVSDKPAGECYWQADADPFGMLRYSKKADKVEAFMAQNYTGLEIYAAGFGAYDNKNLRVKSVSGYAVGIIDPALIACTAQAGNYAPLCDEFDCSVECWDTYGLAVTADDTNTYFAGTWTLKLNNNLTKKQMVKIVPTWVIGTIDATCAE